MLRHLHGRRLAAGLIAFSLIAGTLTLGGCYTRVVGVKGDAAGNYQGEIYEPNLDKDEHIPIIDDVGNALMGDDRR